MYPYTAERRDVLGCTMYIPDDQEISGGSREISRSEGMCNRIHPDSKQCTSILSSLSDTKGCIRKYIPAEQVVLAVLKSILPC